MNAQAAAKAEHGGTAADGGRVALAFRPVPIADQP